MRFSGRTEKPASQIAASESSAQLGKVSLSPNAGDRDQAARQPTVPVSREHRCSNARTSTHTVRTSAPGPERSSRTTAGTGTVHHTGQWGKEGSSANGRGGLPGTQNAHLTPMGNHPRRRRCGSHRRTPRQLWLRVNDATTRPDRVCTGAHPVVRCWLKLPGKSGSAETDRSSGSNRANSRNLRPAPPLSRAAELLSVT